MVKKSFVELELNVESLLAYMYMVEPVFLTKTSGDVLDTQTISTFFSCFNKNEKHLKEVIYW